MDRHEWEAGGVKYEARRHPNGEAFLRCQGVRRRIDGYVTEILLEEMLRLAQAPEAELWRCVEVLSATAADAEGHGMEKVAALLRHIKDALFRGLPVSETLREIGVAVEQP